MQRYSVRYGWGTARTSDYRRRFPKPQFDPLVDIERNRCIMCTRCVRFCDEVAGEHVMGVFGHGNSNYIGTWGNGPVGNVFSGNVIDLCPVGCLTSKPFRFQARAWELRQTLTTTRTCNGAVTAWTRGGKLFRVTPPVRRYHNGTTTLDEDTTDFISNEARFGSYHANSLERLLAPRVRKDGKLVETSWEEALRLAADALRQAEPNEVALLAGERSTNEEFYLLSRLAGEALKTPNLDWRSRFISDEAAQAAGLALGSSDGDLDLLAAGAYGATVMINASDVLAAAPDIALKLKEPARLGRTRLGIMDTRIEPWFAPHARALCLEQPEAMAAALEQLAAALAKDRMPASAPKGYEKLFGLLAGAEQGLLVLGLDSGGGVLNPALVPAVLALLKVLGSGWAFLPVTAARNAKGAFASGAQSAATTAPAILRQAAEGRIKTLLLHRCDELVNHPQRELVERALAATANVIAVDVLPLVDHRTGNGYSARLDVLRNRWLDDRYRRHA